MFLAGRIYRPPRQATWNWSESILMAVVMLYEGLKDFLKE
jgi:hypothetical protein